MRSLLIAVAASACLVGGHARASAGVSHHEPAGPRIERLGGAWIDPALRAAFVRAVEEHAAPAFDLAPLDAGRVVAREAGVALVIDARGIELRTRGIRASLRTTRLGRSDRLELLAAGVLETGGNVARSARTAGDVEVIERWVHGPLGLEHLLDVARRPGGEGPLLVELAVGGELRARAADGDIELLDATGVVRGRYEGGWAEDRARAVLPVALLASRDGRRVWLAVDDAEAEYPIAIDPVVWVEQATLTAGAPTPNANFGWAVDIEGDRAVVGAYADDVATNLDQGSVYVFSRTGSSWALEARLFAGGGLPGAASDFFGRDVAISGDRILVGASGRDYPDTPVRLECGAFYVFLRSGTTWAQEDARVSFNTGERFGTSVSLSGDVALIGAPQATVGGMVGRGAAYIHRRTGTTWLLTSSLVASDGVANQNFGWAVAVSGTTALVGAPLGGLGDVYVFTAATTGPTWPERAILRASAASSPDYFGCAVDLDGGVAIVGAAQQRAAGIAGHGVAYVFRGADATWTEEAMLVPSGGAVDDWAGQSVAISGSVAVVGAPTADAAAAADAGRVTTFARTGTVWMEDGVLLGSDSAPTDNFGWSVAIDRDTVAVGGWHHDTAGQPNAGSAYTFVRYPRHAEGCTADAECGRGMCADGICCFSACGSATDDCQACSVAAGGTLDGTCTALSATSAPSVACRASAGGCDPAERCVAGTTTCPTDTLYASGFECRPAAGACDVAETCSGTSVACPGDALRSLGSLCAFATGAPCDVDDVCTGSSSECPPRYAPASAVCGSPVSGDCDAPDHCAGTSADCVLEHLAAVECRAASGACDAPERCSGTSVTCPPDDVAAAGVVCRASFGGTCDPAEACDGTSSTCPADVTSCGGGGDAGAADAGASDASGSDGGASPPVAAGCACRAVDRRAGLRGVLAMIGVVVVAVGRRRATST